MPETANVAAIEGELAVSVIDDPRDADELRDEWDELAVAAGRPFCSPVWMFAWWEHARTGDARLRTIVIRDRRRVLAIAPFFAQVGNLGLVEYRLLGAGVSQRTGVLWRPGYEVLLADALGDALKHLHPRPSSIVWEGIDARDESPARTAKALGGRTGVTLRQDLELGAPTLRINGRSFDEWLGATTRTFRRGLLKDRRQLEKAGGSIRRTSSIDELDEDLAALARLHVARWAYRGGSAYFEDRLVRMLRDVGQQLLDAARFRLFVVEVDGKSIGAALSITAGGWVTCWGSGMDDAYRQFSPARLAHLAAIQFACERCDHVYDFGGGMGDYKLRFANGVEPIVWVTQFPRGLRYPVTRAQLFPKHARTHLRTLARRLPPERQQQLKRLLRRV